MRSIARSEAAGWMVGLACSLPWLIIPAFQLADTGSGAAHWWGVGILVVLGVLVVSAPWIVIEVAHRDPRAAWVIVAVQVVVVLLMTPIAPSIVPGMLIYPAVVGAALILNARRAFVLLVVLALLAMSVPLWATAAAEVADADTDPAWVSGLLVLALGGWMLGFAQNIRDNEELKRTRALLADAAVTAERERISHDLHDILGHSLTAISVQAAVIRRLAESGADPHSLAGHARAIEQQSRAALADVRATAAGIRDMSLAGEVAMARQTLNAAGIDADLPSAVDHVSPGGLAVFGYVLREAVTNAVRHSGAHRCVVRIAEHSIEIRDDGSGPTGRDQTSAAAEDAGSVAGHGLRGLMWRLESVGGTLEYGADGQRGFVVRAEVPVVLADDRLQAPT